MVYSNQAAVNADLEYLPYPERWQRLKFFESLLR